MSQKGSLCNDEKLRFDFSHSKALTAKELKQVEAARAVAEARAEAASAQLDDLREAMQIGAAEQKRQGEEITLIRAQLSASAEEKLEAQRSVAELTRALQSRELSSLRAGATRARGAFTSPCRRDAGCLAASSPEDASSSSEGGAAAAGGGGAILARFAGAAVGARPVRRSRPASASG